MKNGTREAWAEVLKRKYQHRPWARNSPQSSVWSAVLKGTSVVEKGSKWVIGTNSNLSLRHDKCLNLGPMRKLIEGPLNRGEEDLCVNDITSNGTRDLNGFSFDFSSLIRFAIKSTPLKRVSVREDKLCWLSNLSRD